MIKEISLGMVKAFVIQEEKSILVDTGLPGSAPKILATLKEKGIAPKEIGLIILTHGHRDHTGSAKALKETTGAPIAIANGDAEPLAKGESQRVTPLTWLGKLLFRVLSVVHPHLEPVAPDLIVEGEESLEQYGIKGRILLTPGHTKGSLSIILDSGDAIVGDLIAGKPNHPSLPPFGESADEIKQSICKVCNTGVKRIYASHGGPFDVTLVKKQFGC